MATNVWVELPLEGGGSGNLASINGATGPAISILAGTNVTIGTVGNNITINSTGSGGSGTVTSVGLTSPGVLYTVSGSPVTSSGTLALNLISQTANTFLAAPNGSNGTPSFRAIVAADVPTLNQNTTGTATNITATSNSTLTTLNSLTSLQLNGATSGYITIIPNAITNTYSVSLPASQGSTSSYLINDGSGNLTWTSGTPPVVTNNIDGGSSATLYTSPQIITGGTP